MRTKIHLPFIASAYAMLFGRRTWEVSGPAWSAQSGDPFADRINAIPKYVVSRTLTDASAWNNSTVVDDPRGYPGGEGRVLVMGSPSVVRELVDADLVDEYRLMIEPVVLGGGKSIFPRNGNSRGLELVERPVPVPGPGQVLLRMDAASICGTDHHLFAWDEWAAENLVPPRVLGHELAGTVAATGAGVTRVREGDLVGVESHVVDWTCATCRRGDPHLCRNLRPDLQRL